MSFKDSKVRWGPEHVNSNVICAVDIRVGGRDPSTSDVLEVCFMPLNHSFKLHTEFNMFNLKMKPSWPVDNRVAKVNKDVLAEYHKCPHDSQGGFSLFEYWCEKVLELKPGKKVLPLCYDWGWARPYLRNWMGGEHFDLYISESVRDVQSMMNFVNDRHAFWGDEVPYPVIAENQLYARSSVNLIERNSLVANCKGLIDIYGQTLRSYLPGHATK